MPEVNVEKLYKVKGTSHQFVNDCLLGKLFFLYIENMLSNSRGSKKSVCYVMMCTLFFVYIYIVYNTLVLLLCGLCTMN